MKINIEDFVSRLANHLGQLDWKMTAAESCTGGWIAKVCTDLPGSSEWFERGFVTYSNQAKAELLGVDTGVLNSQGAVSQAVAEAMAQGARERAPVDVSIAVTGIAGPDGGSEDKPVGTVWFAWSIKGRCVDSERCVFEGDRDAVRWQTVIHSLAGLLTRLEHEEAQ